VRQLAASVIVLETADLGERDRIVTFLSAAYGKKRGVARGARQRFSRFAGRLQPLARVQLAWFERDDRDLVRVSDASLERPFAAGDDLERLLLGAYLADTVAVFAQENEPSHALFRLLEMSAAQLAAGIAPQLAGRYFEIWVLRLSGIFPQPRACPQCGRDLGAGAVLVDHDRGLVCLSCAGSGHDARDVVPSAVLAMLVRAGRERLETMAGAPPSTRTLAAVEALCARVRRAFLGRELRSYAMMRQTLGAV